MTLRGRINQQGEDWRVQMSQPRKPAPQPVPDTSDGIDLLTLIVVAWFICLIAGYVIGRL